MVVKFEDGFSLKELMIILAITALLATVATPLSRGWVKDVELTEAREGTSANAPSFPATSCDRHRTKLYQHHSHHSG